MGTFTPRLTSDGITGSKYYYNDNPFYQSGYGMPNCTCYAWGRFYEILGSKPTLSLGNAEDWYLYSDNYERGSAPKLGAVICWRRGNAGNDSDGAGHVAIVEAINADGSIVTSESGWNSDFFWTSTRNNDGNWGASSAYTFQGFIYNPAVSGAITPTEWIAKNAYLSSAEMENNVLMAWQFFGSRGWSKEAVSAMAGNWETESTVNPGIWESLIEYGGGYGLVQWTPYTKYSDWAGADWQNNGDKQCERIVYEMENGLQWFSNPNAPITSPPISFREFSTSTMDVETLANYFLWYYEHPAVTIQPQRATQARKWYEFLSGTTPTPTKKKSMPLWMYLRYF